ncbi:hypothetical protein RI367_006128 [Sorochytrium milnesiophthora]
MGGNIEDIPMDKVAREPGDLESPLAAEYNDHGEHLTERDRELKQLEMEINGRLDSEIAANPDKFPKAVYFILPNEFGERLCYYGLSPLLNIYLQFNGKTKEEAKIILHSWKMVTYFCPLLGAMLSDSYLGKYKTIVYLSFLYLAGNIVITVSSIKALRSLPAILTGLYMVAVGTGGIKATVGAHGGDQFLRSQANQLRKFFSYFYVAINVGSLISSFVPALLKDNIHCFGDEKTCYFAGFLFPTVFFALALGIFIYGERYYRIVPPTGKFVPIQVILVLVDSISGWFHASATERACTDFWQFGRHRYGEVFAAETGELFRMMAMLSPMPFVWMCYDQSSSEWQDQYMLTTVPVSPEIWTQVINSVLIIVLVWFMGTYTYPFMERRGIACTPLRRMGLGSCLITVSFAISGILEVFVVSGPQPPKDPDTGKFMKCTDCVSGLWQLPQWFLLSLAEALFSPSGNEFAYTQAGKSMKSISSGIWLLTVAIGNFIVVAVEESLQHNPRFLDKNTPNKYWLYTGICLASNIMFVLLAHYWYKYKPGSVLKVNSA